MADDDLKIDGLNDDDLQKITHFIMEKYMPWFVLDTDFFENKKIRELTAREQRHFICILSLKRSGKLDKGFFSLKTLDALVIKHLEVGRAFGQRIKKKFQALDLINDEWQPLGWERWQYDKSKRGVPFAACMQRAHEAQQVRREAQTAAERAKAYRNREKQKKMQEQEQQAQWVDVVGEPRDDHHQNVTQERDDHHENDTQERDEKPQNVTTEKTPETRMNSSFEADSSRNFSLHIQKQIQIQKHEHEQKNEVECEEKGVQGEKSPVAECEHSSQSAAPPAARPSALPCTSPVFPPLANFENTDAAHMEAAQTGYCVTVADGLAADDLPDGERTTAPSPLRKVAKTVKQAGRKKTGFCCAVDKPDNVDEQTWNDFLILRESKKASVTSTVLQGFEREARKAGIGLQEAIAFACECNWQCFNAGWYFNRVQPNGNVVTVTDRGTVYGKPAQPKLRPLSFAERDRLRGMQISVDLGAEPWPEYEDLKRRADAEDGIDDGRVVIDISDYPQQKVLNHEPI